MAGGPYGNQCFHEFSVVDAPRDRGHPIVRQEAKIIGKEPASGAGRLSQWRGERRRTQRSGKRGGAQGLGEW